MPDRMIQEQGIKVVLASSSPRRVELLTNLGFEFEVIPSDVDETVEPGKTAAGTVIQLAKLKADTVYERVIEEGKWQEGNKDRLLVLGADTTVVLDNKLLGKPESEEEARAMLRELSGRCHDVFTGVVIISKEAKSDQPEEISSFEMSHVFFRNLTEEEIAAYVRTGEPMDKAGSYALQGIGSAFVQAIEGCFTNVIGLPIPLVVSMLRRAGITILGTTGRRGTYTGPVKS
ncbi:MAG: Maf family protein [Candidatus Obscuribacterales bacterium]|nr:Maf family protein [Candidatus Obscuribacterales bacterium]